DEPAADRRRGPCSKLWLTLKRDLSRVSILPASVRPPGEWPYSRTAHSRRHEMRVMVIVKANEESEAGQMPDEKMLAAMGKYNEELVNAGVMKAGEGLHPSSKGKRMKFSGANRTVIDGPFAETKELIAGFWLWTVKSMDEAVEWLKRAPFDGGTEIEIRPLFETEDFGKEFTPELRAQEQRLREKIGEPRGTHPGLHWRRQKGGAAGPARAPGGRARPSSTRLKELTMMRHLVTIVAVVGVLLSVAAPRALAQDVISKDAAAELKASFAKDLEALHTKFAGLANAFPQDKY